MFFVLWIVPAVLGASAVIGGVSSWLTNRSNAREARRNREFQERMSSTAHQREVADMRAAGINPMFRGVSGSSTPSGDRAEMQDVGRGVSSAVMAGAQLKLMQAQTHREAASAELSRAQAGDLRATVGGRADLLRWQGRVAEMSSEQMRQMMPDVLAKAREEVQLIASSAQAAKARTMLDEAARTGALNEEEFQRVIGESGPWVKFLISLIRGIRR